jgi:sigma-B regulation protein RsbU (phosphoserine phosphatase)
MDNWSALSIEDFAMLEEPQKPKILVVDDVSQNIRLLESSLKAGGYRAILAFSGREALEKVETEQPDLLLLDVTTPEIDGYEVCRRLRQSKKTEALPVIMIATCQQEVDKKKALAIGADDIISKPFDRYEVLLRVKSLLRVKRLYDEAVRTNQRLEDELATAREVQKALMPQEYPDVPGLEFSHKYIPTFSVGGDLFDIKETSPGVVQILVSDVMGHGPQAAMITGIVKTLLTELSSPLAGPGYLLSQINDRFQSLMASSSLPIFVTAFCVVIDTVNSKCKYANAGHPTPFLIHNRRILVKELMNEPGPALGMIPSTLYRDYERDLESGDMLFLFTDGLQELRNRDGAQFGPEELKRTILSNAYLSPHSFVEAIMYAADAFSDSIGIPDDITLLAVSYHRLQNINKP